MVYDIRGSLEDNCTFEISIPGTSVKDKFTADTIPSTWTTQRVPIGSGVGEVSYLLGMNLVATNYEETKKMTAGGEVFIDNVRLVKTVS